MIKTEELFSNEGTTKSDRSLHTPGSFAKQNLLYVQEVGRLQSLTPHRCIREKLDSFLFLVVLEGKGCLDIGEKQYEISVGDCALIDCMQHYEHISDEADAWRLAWVHFNGQIAREYYDLFMKYNNGSSVFRVEDVKAWNALVGELLEKQKDRGFLAELSCGEILMKLMNRVIEAVVDVPTVDQESCRQSVYQIREFLNENYAESGILEELSKKYAKPVGELTKDFQYYLGIGIEEYIDNRRLNAAKELLRFSIKPIDTVAREAGIGSVDALQKVFREQEGMSAEEYREKWAQWIR